MTNLLEQLNQKDPTLYLNNLKNSVVSISKDLNFVLLPASMSKSIKDLQEKLLYLIDAEKYSMSNPSYESSQNWQLNKNCLESLYNDLIDKVHSATEYVKSMQNVRQ